VIFRFEQRGWPSSLRKRAGKLPACHGNPSQAGSLRHQEFTASPRNGDIFYGTDFNLSVWGTMINFVQKLTRSPKRLLIMLALLLSITQSAAARSVEDFLAMREKWPELIGVSFKIQGRLSTAAGNIVILKNCKGIQFRSTKELPVFREKGIVVEVSGILKKDEAGKIFLQVSSLKNLGTDLSRLIDRRNDLLRDDIEGLFKLAEWAETRGTDYEDEVLINESRKMFRAALQKERIGLDEPRYADLKRLARKVEKYSLRPELKVSLIHEGYYWEWRAIRKEASSNELLGWAGRVAAELPGANTKLSKYDADLAKRYMDQPLQFHENSTPGKLPDVHRMLYLEVVRDGIKKLADPDAINGIVVADRIEKLAPEFASWATEFRLRELDYRLTIAEKMRRSEMLRLRRDLDDHKRTKDSKEVLQRWFRYRTNVLRGEGPDGLIQLAIEYDELLGDKAASIRLLLEAERAKPGTGKVSQRLTSYGFKQVNGVWKSPEQIVHVPDSPIVIAMREGRVVEGMNAEQVEKTLGKPVAITRILTSRRLTEYWVYGTESNSGISVRLKRLNITRPALVDKIIDLQEK
jgi:hypothetical protein